MGEPFRCFIAFIFFSQEAVGRDSKASYRSCYCQGFAAVTHSPRLQDLQCWFHLVGISDWLQVQRLWDLHFCTRECCVMPASRFLIFRRVALCCQLAIRFICFCWVWVEILVVFLILLQIPQNASEHFGVLSLSNVEVFSCVKTNI